MPTLLIASANPGKLREFNEIFQGMPFELALPASLGIELDVKETGQTYAENAALKALAYSQASGLPALADDSGLEVDVLGGEPGIRSARYAPGPNPGDAGRRRYLLECLVGKPRPWRAHFHATVAVATPGGEITFSEGRCYGQVIDTERGEYGFGYDPIFLLDETGCTMAELEPEAKNRLSHRARAAAGAVPAIYKVLGLS